MNEKHFSWTQETVEKFFVLRLEHEWLFKKKKQAWKDFYKILMENNFPESLQMDQMRKKWQYTLDAYKEAKRENNTNWLYFTIFDKYLGKQAVVDKYQSWSDEWRLKLLTAYEVYFIANSQMRGSRQQLLREVEKELRSSGLPIDCCIQDIQGLLQYLKTTFRIKTRVKVRKGEVQWPLYDAVRRYLETCCPVELHEIERDCLYGCEAKKKQGRPRGGGEVNNDTPLNWNRHMTESFIQFRLQHEWLFKEKKQPWEHFVRLMIENGYTGINKTNVQKKWHTIYSGYQKALAENNTKWLYYDLFKLYLDETVIDPLYGWQEHWVKELIHTRSKKNDLFEEYQSQTLAWREVEKELRTSGIPLDHTLLEIQHMWEHLKKSYRWKSKFAARGTLTESWPYYDLMSLQHETEAGRRARVKLSGERDNGDAEGFDDDDVKPLCFISKMEVGEGAEETRCCRACGSRRELLSLWGQEQLATKLAAIADVEVEQSDGLPEHICKDCRSTLESAYQFRLKCQQSDKQQRSLVVKQEAPAADCDEDCADDAAEVPIDCDTKEEHDHVGIKLEKMAPSKRSKRLFQKAVKKPLPRKEKGVRKTYRYVRICDVCGKSVHNMSEHAAAHRGERHACHECGKTFLTKSGLYTHMLSHTNKTVATCSVCGKKFRTNAAHRRHFAYHLNERRHACESCGKGFNSAEILKVHRLIHTGERPHSCSECGKSFRTVGCVGRHKRIVHKMVQKKDC